MVRVKLFGDPHRAHRKRALRPREGAYTGALSKQIGRFEVADGSTLVLDELGDLPLEVQVKLLRVLQERTIERLGSSRSVAVDVRIIAATNRDLEQAVREGAVRTDLFYRLNVFPIRVPPLRNRREDIPALVLTMVEEIGAAMGKRFGSMAKASLEALQHADWPGNARKLHNVVERATILASGPVLRIELGDRPAVMASPPGPRPAIDSPRLTLRDVERAHIIRTCEDCGWRIKGPDAASVRLGLKPSTLYNRMHKLGIARPA
jgi:formate hydrogenlyase transcriptional activator